MSRVIDLTVSMKDGMRGVTFETFKELEKDGWNARMLHLYSHAGTHMDAPLHFGVNDTTIDRIPPERFIADAWVIDAPAVRSSMLIGIDHLKDVKDKLIEGEGLLFRTGWHRFIDSRELPDGPALDRAVALARGASKRRWADRRRAAVRGEPDRPCRNCRRCTGSFWAGASSCGGSLQSRADHKTQGEDHRAAAQDRRRRRGAGEGHCDRRMRSF